MCVFVRQQSRAGLPSTSFIWHLLTFRVSLFISKSFEDLRPFSSNFAISNSFSQDTAASSLKTLICGFPCPLPWLSLALTPSASVYSATFQCRILLSATGFKFISSTSSSSCSVSLLLFMPPSIPMALKLCLLAPKQRLGCLRKL